jgi:hypothetical protein
MKIDHIKQEVIHDMENLRKKNETEVQNTMEATQGYYSKHKTESQNLMMKWKLKEKLTSY